MQNCAQIVYEYTEPIYLLFAALRSVDPLARGSVRGARLVHEVARGAHQALRGEPREAEAARAPRHEERENTEGVCVRMARRRANVTSSTSACLAPNEPNIFDLWCNAVSDAKLTSPRPHRTFATSVSSEAAR